MAKKVYAVKKGRKTGIYFTWDEAKKQINGYRGAIYKGFLQRDEAEKWLNGASETKKITITKKVSADAIVLYTDGGSRNTGNVRGGHVRKEDTAAWAFLIKKDDKEISGSGGEFGATNNRMEITALIQGLHKICELYGNDAEILVVADSKYVLDAIREKWIWGWQRRGWKKSNGEVVANKELWQEVAKTLKQMPNIELTWTKGHATNDGNVYVDHLLNETMDRMVYQPTKVKTIEKAVDSKPSTIASESTTNVEQLGLFSDD